MTRLIPLLLALPLAASAAENGHSLRLGLQGMPTDYETETTVDLGAFSGAGEGEGEWEDAGRVTLGYRWTPDRDGKLAFGLGVGLALTGFADDGNGEFEMAGVGAWIAPGLIWRPLTWLELEAGAHLGGGSAGADAAGGFEYDTTSYGELGLDLRAVVVLRRVELMLEGGWLSQTAEFDWENDTLGAEGTTEVTTAGGWGGIAVGFRL